jgi:branched-subunit amino acid transport protein
MNELLLIIGMTLVTFGVRYPTLALVSRLRLPPVVIRALGFVPVAVLTAIVLPELVMPGGMVDVSPGNTRLIAGMVAVLIAWRTRSLLLTIVAGMGLFLVLQLLR